MSESKRLTIVGAGLAGALLATLLARRGWEVDVFERRGDPRIAGYAGGRSINLALAERGLHALRIAGAAEAVLAKAVMMRGRMVHFLDGSQQLQRYGRDDSEVIWSVQPRRTQHHAARRRRGRGCAAAFRPPPADRSISTARSRGFVDDRDGTPARARLHRADRRRRRRLRAARRRLGRHVDLGERLESLGHGYKELEIPPAPDGGFRIEPNALHIWPRGRYMCIALPNDERTFTVTLFLPSRQGGQPSFDTVRHRGRRARAVRARLRRCACR